MSSANPQRGHGPEESGRGAGRLILRRRRSGAVPSIPVGHPLTDQTMSADLASPVGVAAFQELPVRGTAEMVPIEHETSERVVRIMVVAVPPAALVLGG